MIDLCSIGERSRETERVLRVFCSHRIKADSVFENSFLTSRSGRKDLSNRHIYDLAPVNGVMINESFTSGSVTWHVWGNMLWSSNVYALADYKVYSTTH